MSDPFAHEGQEPIDFLTEALRYAASGWRVLPVYPGEKRPVPHDWPAKASCDPKQISDWWIDNPRFNIGLACGPESGFFVLDIDPKSGGDHTLASLVALHGSLPRTYTVRTGSGGLHYYFAYPDFDLGNSPGDLKGSGIDVRGQGGQVVAPPSVTVLGAYSVLLSANIAPAPEWLLSLLRPRVELHLVTPLVPTPEAARPELLTYVDNAIRHAATEVACATVDRNIALNNQVLAIAGIAAHDASLVDADSLYEQMRVACQTNGYLASDGLSAFKQTFKSAWQAGLKKPRRSWPPRLSGGVFIGPQHTALPVVNVSSRKLNEIVDEVLGNIAAANDLEPLLFAHGSEVVTVVDQPPRTASLDANMLAYEADTRMHFEKNQPNGGKAVAQAPPRVIDTIMSMPVKPFPPLIRISYTPFFAPSGRYVDTVGYDSESRTYYSPTPGLSVPEIPSSPTASEVRSALAYVQSNVLVDFRFVSDADRAHALALMLLPFVRGMIAGPTPLHNIEAPTPGSGKGLLMKSLLMPAVGGRHITAGEAKNPEEWEKRLVSFLRLSPQALVLDNVNDKLASGFLCTALTEPEVSSRLLGVSQQVTIPVRTTWVMTANNPKFSDEVARRTLRIRVDSGVERPEDRTGFVHSDLLAWTVAHRAELIAACCTMIRGWVAEGAPEVVPAKPFGSFEHWHSIIGGLLSYLGVDGLLENKEDFLSASDDESIAWDALVTQLACVVRPLGGVPEWSSAELAQIVMDSGIAIDLGREGSNRALMMGRELSKQRDRWHSGRQFHKRVVHGKTYWRLEGAKLSTE